MPANLDRYAHALEHAERHWKLRREDLEGGAQAQLITVALMREAGAGGTSIAQEVGKRLGWPVYDRELLELIAREMGLRVGLLESVDERNPGWLREAFQAFADVPQVRENAFVRHLVEIVLSLGSHGRCIIVGRASAQILPPDTTLRIRLIAQLKDRIAATARRLALSDKEAARWVEETERERRRFVREHFLKDVTDPLGYDLLVNTSRFTVAQSAELIVQAVRCREAHTPP
jgi:cytidylate kinase